MADDLHQFDAYVPYQWQVSVERNLPIAEPLKEPSNHYPGICNQGMCIRDQTWTTRYCRFHAPLYRPETFREGKIVRKIQILIHYIVSGRK